MVLINIDANDGKEGLKINEFTLDQMVEHPAIVMVAKRGSGKSYVCRAILHHFHSIPCGIIISRTEKMNAFYGTFFPDSFVFYEYKTEIIEKILKRQEIMIEKARKKLEQGKKLDPRSFIIMDDCLSQKGAWVRDQPIQELLFNGRHYKIMYILTMQFPLGITPELRINFDYIFLMAEDTISNLKRIYDHYAGMFPNFYSFKQVFTELTKDFGCMVIVNRGSRTNIFEKIYHYKAPDFGKNDEIVLFGCNQFRKYHDKNYNPDWSMKARQGSFEQMMDENKKAKSDIKIRIVDAKDNKKK